MWPLKPNGAIVNDLKRIYYFPALDSMLYEIIKSPTKIDQIQAGANHFLLLTRGQFVYSYGDNRFDQCGHSLSCSATIPLASVPVELKEDHREEDKKSFEATRILNPIEFFSALVPVTISTGDFHSVVLTADGSAYRFGKDYGSPELITLIDDEIGQGSALSIEEEPEIVGVDCGCSHTILVTREGEIWTSGSSTTSIICPRRPSRSAI